MALVNTLKKIIRMDRWDIVRFQIMLYCHLNKVSITDQGLDCLTLLALTGEKELSEFCELVADKNIFRNSQSVRTALSAVEKKGLITTFKIGKSKKRIKLKDSIIIESKGNILLDLKVLRVESEEG